MKKIVTVSYALAALVLMLFASVTKAQQPCHLQIEPDSVITVEGALNTFNYKVILVKNNSDAEVTVSAQVSGPEASAFTLPVTSFVLKPDGVKEFKVVFSPNSSTARYFATLSFGVSGVVCTSADLVGVLSGGDNKGLIVDPGSIKFPVTDIGSVSCKEVTIKNMSTSAATISAISITGSQAFIIDGGLTFPLTIGAGDAETITVCYKPLEQPHAYATGKVEIAYLLANAGETKKVYISLSSGANSGGDNLVFISPSQFQFPATEVGQTVCKEFRVVNKSDMKALISSFSFEGSEEFTVTSLTPLPVEINSWDSLYIKVCYTPTSANSDAKGSLSVNYSLDGGITTKHATAVFFAMSEKPSCVESSGTDAWKEPILVGGTSDRTLIVSNKTNSAITITDIRLVGEDIAAFTINATTPITIPAMSKVEIPFTFAPFAGQNGYLKEKYIAAVVLALSSEDPASDCTIHEGHVWGYALNDHDKDSASVAISLFPNEKQTIGLSNRGIKESYTLLFKNNLDKEIIIQSISMMDGTKFKITATDPATTPFNLTPGATFTVTIEFESADGLLYKDKLIIVSDFAATAIEFDMQGINAEKALSVITMPEGVSVAVTPNPMRSNATVDLEGVRSATIEVADVLGSTVMTAVATGDWNWNGRMSNGAIAPAGTYFVRVLGESTNGERFVTTQRIVIER